MILIYFITLAVLAIGLIVALTQLNLSNLELAFTVSAIVVTNFTCFIITYSETNKIESKIVIKPELNIHITKDKVDTTYIYKQ